MKELKQIPFMKSPCKDCPFRKDSLKGWLGKKRITEILGQDSFVCHKTVDYDKSNVNDRSRQQCAGHMILKKENNSFFRLLMSMFGKTELTGEDQVFDSDTECIKHHSKY